jgi:hypothetical protein
MTTITFEASKVKPYITDKQLPAGWDDDDNAPFELEFFEFLQEHRMLDLYIKYTTEASGGLFTLPVCCHNFIYGAFTFSVDSDCNQLAVKWHEKLATLTDLNRNRTN